MPTDENWTTLTTYLGGEDVAGSKLIETSVVHWNSSNTPGTNETGFTALPGGTLSSSGTFGYIGLFGCWWSAAEVNTTGAWCRYMYYNYTKVLRDGDNKKNGHSVRCLMN
jgi:uncharacterized protein (TIGR02145 family)